MDMLSVPIWYFQLKSDTPIFWRKVFVFAENLFQSKGIENIQNFPWFSHKNMPISQMKGYFENPLYRLLEELMHFLVVWK